MHSTPYGLGLDISDRSIVTCLRQPDGSQVDSSLPAARGIAALALRGLVELQPVVALETGTHSNWVFDLLKELGFQHVIVADARMLKVIFQSDKKTDRHDAQTLARLAQVCPDMLHGVRPRGEQARQDRRLLSARNAAVETRTKLITCVRGLVKATGARLAECDADNFSKLRGSLDEDLAEELGPLFELVEQHGRVIDTYDRRIDERCRGDATIKHFKQVKGVGNITALAFRSTIEDPWRFKKTRDVASYVGLRPRLDESGESKKQLGITKRGDGYLRRLLVQCAHVVLQKRSSATDLKRWGQRIAEEGGKRGKRRAVVAVARKLAVVLLALWKSGGDYVPVRDRGVIQQDHKAPAVPATTKRRRAGLPVEAWVE